MKNTMNTEPSPATVAGDIAAMLRSGAMDSYESERAALAGFAQLHRLDPQLAEALWVRNTTPNHVKRANQ